MYKVIKRDGALADFNINKIVSAIAKAFNAQNKQYNQDVIDFLALKVTADYQAKIEYDLIGVESIQDSVERVLVQAGYADVAKAYILYRKQREKVRNTSTTLLDYKELVNGYVKIDDWRVKENSTVTYSRGRLNPEQLRRDYGQLLAVGGVRRGNRQCTPQRRSPHPRSVHAHGLLRGLVLKAAHHGRPWRDHRQNHLLPRQPSVHAVQPDGQLPGHHAKRMGRRAGSIILRYLSCAVCEGRQPELQGS